MVVLTAPNSSPAWTHVLSCGFQMAVRRDQVDGGSVTLAAPSSTRPSARTEPLQSPRTNSKADGLLIGVHVLVCGSNVSPLHASLGAAGSVLSSPPMTNTRPSRSTPDANHCLAYCMFSSPDHVPVSYRPCWSGVSLSHWLALATTLV